MLPPDETDLQLINVMQVAPRANWVHMAPILGISPTAVAARWRRITDSGLAWICAFPVVRPSDHVTALIAVRVKRPLADDRVMRLCRDARIIGVDEVSGAGRLLLTVSVHDLHTLRTMVNEELPAIGWLQVRALWIVTEAIRVGADWRLDALNAEQRDQVRTLSAVAPVEESKPDGSRSRGLPDSTQTIIDLLAVDGRVTAAAIARQVGRDPSTVRRQLQQVLSLPLLQLRCDVSNEEIGWPVTSVWLGKVSAPALDATTAVLRDLPEVRVCFVVTGDADLFFSAYHRTLEGVSVLRRKLTRLAPDLDMSNSRILLRSRKRTGWLLTENGRRSDEFVRPVVLDAELLGDRATSDSARRSATAPK